MKFLVIIITLLTMQNVFAGKANEKIRITRLEWTVYNLNLQFHTHKPAIEFMEILPNTIKADVDFKPNKKDPNSVKVEKGLTKLINDEVAQESKKWGITEKVKVKINWEPLEMSDEELDQLKKEKYWFLQKKPKIMD